MDLLDASYGIPGDFDTAEVFGSKPELSKVDGALVPGIPALALGAALSPADSEQT